MIKVVLVLLTILFFSYKVAGQDDVGFKAIDELEPLPVSVNTSDKPQSKVWQHGGKWWAVLPVSSGTYIWRLDGKVWVQALRLNQKDYAKADCRVVGNVVHILLFRASSPAQIASAEYDAAAGTYRPWSGRAGVVELRLDAEVETATMDIDSRGRMWVASDGETKVNVRWSDPPYTNWQGPHTLDSNISTDDLCGVVALPGKVGVLWSDQVTKRFGFRVHTDGTDPTSWSEDEVPASQSAQNVKIGMADDHLNMAVASDGTLYCAVKTGYDTPGHPRLALLVRRPSGSWDNLYEVSQTGTRPIVVLNEALGRVKVIYSSVERGGDILYRESPTSNISFSSERTLIRDTDGSLYNYVTSTKNTYDPDVVIMASGKDTSDRDIAVSVLASDNLGGLPVELAGFSARMTGDDVLLQWSTASEENNDFFSIESSTDGYAFSSIGSVAGSGTTQQPQHYTFMDKGASRYGANQLYYRLKQVDFSGEATYSPIRSVRPAALEELLSVISVHNQFL